MWAVRVPKPIRALVKQMVKMWATDLCLWTPDGPEHMPIHMKRGIYQGDSLSPLLFCLCVAPLSKALRATKGFQSTHQIHPVTHLMFVDDLKVYADGKSGLEEAVKVVENVSRAMGMELGLKKCAVAHMIGGSEEMRGSIALRSGAEKQELEEGDAYRDLGVVQRFGADLRKTKQGIERAYISEHGECGNPRYGLGESTSTKHMGDGSIAVLLGHGQLGPE